MQKDTLQIFVKSLDDQKLEYKVSPSLSIAELKALIGGDTSLDSQQIRLIYQAKNLANDKLLKDIVDKDGEVFHLIARLQPPPQ